MHIEARLLYSLTCNCLYAEQSVELVPQTFLDNMQQAQLR